MTGRQWLITRAGQKMIKEGLEPTDANITAIVIEALEVLPNGREADYWSAINAKGAKTMTAFFNATRKFYGQLQKAAAARPAN